MANVIEKNLRTLALNGAGEVERAQLRYIVNNSKAADDDRALLVQVLEGITPGDTVITTGTMQLRTGQKVILDSVN